VLSTMAYEQDATGRLQTHVRGKKTNGSVVSNSRLLLLQRRLKRNKRTTTTTQRPNTVRTQRKKLDGFLEKTQSKLTISTAETSCTSSLSQSLPLANHSFEYQISRMPSQQTFGSDSYGSGSMEDSLADSFATFAISSQRKDATALFKEWRSLYVLSAGNSENHADDEGDDTQEEFPSDEKTISSQLDTDSRAGSQADGQVIIHGSPSDLLSAAYTIESSSDTMSAPNQHIPTPPQTTTAACSFNLNFFGSEILKSVANAVSQMTAQGKDESGVNDDNSEYSNDNSSCSEKSDSSEETNNLILDKLLHYDEGETKPKLAWTFESFEAGTVDSEF